jgi:hypothetical protein
MSQENVEPLRVLFCIGVSQNFFDLPTGETGAVWQGYSNMMRSMAALPGVKVLGTLDDDRLVVGPTDGWPWTVYIMADVPDYETVVAACNLFRTIRVGEHNLWKYGRIEARIGRALQIPPAA